VEGFIIDNLDLAGFSSDPTTTLSAEYLSAKESGQLNMGSDFFFFKETQLQSGLFPTDTFGLVEASR
jgi:hypothetical protein